jgi:predicted TIM-barrel fold metal-dependent hydrolase
LNNIKVIDSHLHLNSWNIPDLKLAAEDLNTNLVESNTEKALVLHLLCQPWKIEDVAKVINENERLLGMANIDPFSNTAKEDLKYAIEELKFVGLKLHPRLQHFSPEDEKVIEIVKYAGELNVPTLIDVFPDGTALMDGFDPLKFAKLATECPESKIIFAHMGGHYCIDFMMLAKRLPNVHMDISYSLLYYKGSSVPQNMMYACKSMRYDRVMYGSDYPDRKLKVTVDESLKIFSEHSVSVENTQKVFYNNFKELFNV